MEKFYILIGCMVYQILLNYVDLRSVLFFAFKLYLNSKEKQNEICHTNSKFVNERRTKYTQTHRHTIRQAKREDPPTWGTVRHGTISVKASDLQIPAANIMQCIQCHFIRHPEEFSQFPSHACYTPK